MIEKIKKKRKIKSSKSQLDFIMPIKLTTKTEWWGEGKEKKKTIQKNLQNKSNHKNNRYFS